MCSHIHLLCPHCFLHNNISHKTHKTKKRSILLSFFITLSIHQQQTTLSFTIMLSATSSLLLRRGCSSTLTASALLKKSPFLAASSLPSSSSSTTLFNGNHHYRQQNQLRFKSDDAGDVIGIDLGTTNSCVAIMVRKTHILWRDDLYSCFVCLFVFCGFCVMF